MGALPQRLQAFDLRIPDLWQPVTPQGKLLFCQLALATGTQCLCQRIVNVVRPGLEFQCRLEVLDRIGMAPLQ